MPRKTTLCLVLMLLFVLMGAARGAPETKTTAVITLSGSSASAEGEGVTIDGSTVTISMGGSFWLTGALEDGQILVDAGRDETVELILNGASMTSSVSAAIYAKQAEMTIVTLAEGTENVIRDAPDNESGAALYAEDGLLIRGTGTLYVYGNHQNGVASKDGLIVEDGTISIEAPNHGLRGKDSVSVLGGALTIRTGNDGIQADHAKAGTVRIEGGMIDITCAHDGIQAEGMLIVSGGEINILAGGGSAAGGYADGESYKGLKSGGSVLISGGTVFIDSLDDTVHAAKSVAVSGGALTLLSGDDGIHADETLTISGGTVDIANCYEGLESAVVNISGGTIILLSDDDGINAADAKGGGTGYGDTGLQVNISGGVISVSAYGDGIDSNGVVTMSGGELYISGPLSSRNGALDYDNSFLMSGGLLAAAGSIRMAQTPGPNSTQPSVIVYFSQPRPAGNTYLLTDESGTALLSITPDKNFECIVLSAPELKTGGSYAVYESSDGTMANAILLYDFTISGIISSVGGTIQTR